jgi:hypothetical protein
MYHTSMSAITPDRRIDPIADPFRALVIFARLGLSLDEALQLWPYSDRYSRDECESAVNSAGASFEKRRGRKYRTRRGRMTVREALEKSGVRLSPQAVHYRLRAGMSLEEATQRPVMSYREAARRRWQK